MRLHRFLITESIADATICITDKDTLHQWLRVLRYTGGEDVILIDGKGLEVVGIIAQISKEEATIQVKERMVSVAPTTLKLTLCFSPLKRELTELVFQKGTELGVDVFQPSICERTIKDRINQERLTRIVQEATEQSGRVWAPEIRSVCSLGDAIATHREYPMFFASLLVKDSASVRPTLTSMTAMSLFIGPEGGWTEQEEAQAIMQGLVSLRLSQHVLRAETACIAGVALLRASIA